MKLNDLVLVLSKYLIKGVESFCHKYIFSNPYLQSNIVTKYIRYFKQGIFLIE